MGEKGIPAWGGKGARRAMATLLALLLTAALVPLAPGQAFAYFNRGSVGVELGASHVQLDAGTTADVSVVITPSSDQQTEGCGMPKCPQSCAETCIDEIGQCRCAGKDLSTYYPTAVATSSNTGVAMASYRGGRLSIFGRSEGTATITLRASLRQFTDAEATLDVTVSGSVAGTDAAVVPPEFMDVPEEANLDADDRQDLVEKTAMGRPIRFVRIEGHASPEQVLASLVGTDGETTFWSGDTLHQPDYSVTVMAEDCTSADAAKLTGRSSDAFSLAVSNVAEGALTQPLAGLDRFVSVSFAEGDVLPCKATVYARANGALADGEGVSLFSYDAASKLFVAEEQPAEVVGEYVKFTADEPKAYVVSSRDLTAEANSIVDSGTPLASGDEDGAVGATIPVAVPIAVVAAAVVAIAAILMVRSKRKAAR